MIWLWAAVLSALLLGLYDVFKKKALRINDVMHLLLCTTAISTLFFLPLILSSIFGWGLADGTVFELPACGLREHLLIIVKAFIVTLSWVFGLFGLKHLPITTVGIIKASRPVFVLIGCIFIFGERLNALQWIGVIVAIVALFLLGRSSKKEGIDFTNNKWIFCMAASVLFGVLSALFDKYIMKQMKPMFVQGWCNFYITVILAITIAIMQLIANRRHAEASVVKGEVLTKFRWDWLIPVIAVFITASDFLYFYSLTGSDSLLSVISMLRRSSVIVTFICGAIMFKEGHLREKGFAMGLLLAGMALLVFGTC
jgi:Predicted membrane protein